MRAGYVVANDALSHGQWEAIALMREKRGASWA